MLHIHNVTENSNVVIKCNDSDILLILLGNMDKFTDKNVWMEVGFVTKNTLRYININSLANNLGMQICKALPAFMHLQGVIILLHFLVKENCDH